MVMVATADFVKSDESVFLWRRTFPTKQRYGDTVLQPLPLRPPRMWIMPVLFLVTLGVCLTVSKPYASPLNWYLSVAWSFFGLIASFDICGMFYARKVINSGSRFKGRLSDATLVALVVTKGEQRNLQSLLSVVRSLLESLPWAFEQWRVAIVTEEPPMGDGLEAIQAFVAGLPPKVRQHVLLLVRPKSFATPNGTKFKARANQFALNQLKAQGLIRDNVWLAHFDDDNCTAPDTAQAIAGFIDAQRHSREPKLLAQGVLTYVRRFAHSLPLWLADAIRTGDDFARFAFFTGLRGTPIAGLHGELLLTRSDVEHSIGWDFGPKELTEDARLAMIFARRYPGRSGWFAGRCYSAAPCNVREFIIQRRRWAQGLLNIAFDGTVPLRQRWLMMGSMIMWTIAMLQNIAFVVPLAFVVGDGSISPVITPVLVLWCLGFADTVAKYMEGLRANTHASGLARPKLIWYVLLFACLPWFAVLEALGGWLGFVRYMRMRCSQSYVPTFDTVNKTAVASDIAQPELEGVAG